MVCSRGPIDSLAENTEPYLEQMTYLSSGRFFYQKGDRNIQAEINGVPMIASGFGKVFPNAAKLPVKL